MSSLLQERAPREVLSGASAIEPNHVLSKGCHSVALRANGAGWSRWGKTGITRGRDEKDSFFYLRCDRQPWPCASPGGVPAHVSQAAPHQACPCESAAFDYK